MDTITLIISLAALTISVTAMLRAIKNKRG